ncbi:hypothetical protein BDV18DRAFT_155919 [Aspergillus unguis]
MPFNAKRKRQPTPEKETTLALEPSRSRVMDISSLLLPPDQASNEPSNEPFHSPAELARQTPAEETSSMAPTSEEKPKRRTKGVPWSAEDEARLIDLRQNNPKATWAELLADNPFPGRTKHAVEMQYTRVRKHAKHERREVQMRSAEALIARASEVGSIRGVSAEGNPVSSRVFPGSEGNTMGVLGGCSMYGMYESGERMVVDGHVHRYTGYQNYVNHIPSTQFAAPRVSTNQVGMQPEGFGLEDGDISFHYRLLQACVNDIASRRERLGRRLHSHKVLMAELKERIDRLEDSLR